MQKVLEEHLLCSEKGIRFVLPLYKSKNVIIGRSLIARDFFASFAFVDDHEAAFPILIEGDGLQEPCTLRQSVPRTIAVDVLGIEALRTVVAVGALAQGLNKRRALLAGEGFFARDEGHMYCAKM